jgi:ClpP class serine protease
MNIPSTAVPTALRIASTIAWGVTPEYLDIIEAICAGLTDPKAVATDSGERKQNTRTVEIRDGVAIIPVYSVIFRRAGLFDDISGAAASVQTIAKDFYAALHDPAVKAIIFDFDTPGGEVNGIAELAAIIYASRGIKPIKAYVGDLCASAGYWLAVACDEIIMHRTARVGSIGILAIANIAKNPNQKRFTSKHAPNKNVPADTSKGESLIQEEIDTAGDMFIEDVATMRAVSNETVLADFGQGGILFAEAAIAVGMADRLGSYEGLITELQQGGKPQAANTFAVVVDKTLVANFQTAVSALSENQIEIRKIQKYD